MVAAFLTSLISLADGAAAGAAPAAATGKAAPGFVNGLFNSWLLPMLGVYAVIWFMWLAPKRKEQKQLSDWLAGIKKGDEVVTSGGLIGKISGLTEQTVTLEVQEKVRLKVLRSHIAGKAPSSTAPAAPSAETQPAK